MRYCKHDDKIKELHNGVNRIKELKNCRMGEQDYRIKELQDRVNRIIRLKNFTMERTG